MPSARNFFTPQEQQMIVEAIKTAELKTSGEIRVHIDNFCFGNALKTADKLLTRLGMRTTKERNGVLIYIAVKSRKLAIAGDEGIHQKLGADYWNTIVDQLIREFKNNRKAEALAACILDCGVKLAQYFPRQEDDKNELDNSISFKS